MKAQASSSLTSSDFFYFYESARKWRAVKNLDFNNLFENIQLCGIRTGVIDGFKVICQYQVTMKQKLWIALITYLAYCIDKELYKAIDYLWEQFCGFRCNFNLDHQKDHLRF